MSVSLSAKTGLNFCFCQEVDLVTWSRYIVIMNRAGTERLGKDGDACVCEWSSEMEEEFRNGVYESAMPRLRLVAGVTSVLYAAVVYADYLALGFGEPFEWMVCLRGIILVLGVCTALCHNRTRRGDRLAADALCLYMFAMMFAESAEVVLKADHTVFAGMSATTFIVLAFYLFTPPGLWIALAPGLGGSLLFVLALAAATPAPTEYVWVTLLNLALANGFGIYFINHNEQIQRREFSIMLQLRRFTDMDMLTGTFNRRCVLEQGQRQFGRARQYGETLSLLLMDLDHFKTVNDTLGHGAGDAVLAAFAERCREVLREADLFGRVAGEEFVVLLPRCDAAQAVEMAEQIRAEVARRPFGTGYSSLSVSVSIGVVQLGDDDRSIESLITRADEALNQAKKGGRNRVCTSGVPFDSVFAT